MPTHDATTRLYRKLVEVIGQEECDTLFALIWEAKGREPIDFRRIYGIDGPTKSPASSG
jgi:hypothetical protein